MTVSDARSWITTFARNAGDTQQYSNTDFDRAVQAAGNYFIRATGCTRKRSQVRTVSSNRNITAGWPTLFRPDLLNWVQYSTKPPMDVLDYQALLSLHEEDATTGYPKAIAWITPSEAAVWPTPDAAYDIILVWQEPFTAWTPGATDYTTTNTTLNIPDDLMQGVMAFGAPAFLQHTHPEQQFVNPAWQKFQELIRQCQGVGSLGPKTAVRSRVL